MKLTIWLSCYKLVTLLPGVSGRLFSNIFHCGFLWLVCFVKGGSIFLEWESVTLLETKNCITILNKQTRTKALNGDAYRGPEDSRWSATSPAPSSQMSPLLYPLFTRLCQGALPQPQNCPKTCALRFPLPRMIFLLTFYLACTHTSFRSLLECHLMRKAFSDH